MRFCRNIKKGEYFYEFTSIKNSVLNKESGKGSNTELNEILVAIKEQIFCNEKEVEKRFWDIFIVNSYLGNFDRHNGNWGILVNEDTEKKD